MGARSKIVNALVVKLKEIDGSVPYTSNLFTNVFNNLKFFDEVSDFPAVFVNAGPETREYLPGNFKWGYLTLIVRVYVKGEEPETLLEDIFSDIEYTVDTNGNLVYDATTGSKIEDLRIMSINTDEGLLAPIGVGDITLHIQYDLESN